MAAPTLLSLDPDSLINVLTCCAVRDILSLACACRSLKEQIGRDDLWQEIAVQKWGPAVKELARVQAGGWAAWTRHRLSLSSAPLSPLDLVQEHYQACPFQHLVSCVLCSRTTGGPVVRGAIQLFLDLYPTPSAVLDAADDSMLEVMRPLGLPATRLAAVRGIARDFLASDWEDPAEFKHCGKFVSDSFHIFCRGRLDPAGVEDKNLQRYLRWRQHGSLEEKGKKEAGSRPRKRKAEKPAEAGTLRSGRRRGGGNGAGSAGGGEGAPGRRQTRASAAAAAEGSAGGSKARKA